MSHNFPSTDYGYLCNAARLSSIALAAYKPSTCCGSPNLREWPNCQPFEAKSESGVVVWDDRNVVIGIAGTDDLYNFITNFDVRTHKVGKLEVHKGLWDECQIVALAVKDLVHEHGVPHFDDPNRRWWVTGHSAGGAKASLLPLCIPNLNPTGIYTFASPRCFKTNTVGYYGYNTYRFDYPYDIIPDIPFHSKLRVFKRSSGWSHVGRPVYLKRNGDIDTENGYWLKRLIHHIAVARSLRPSRIFKAAIIDHSMFRNYHLPLQRWANIQQTENHSD